MALNNVAIADNPRAKALIQEGLRIFNDEQYSEATEYFTKALSIEPESAAAHYYLGECYRHLFEYEKAAPQYQMAVANDSTAFPLAHFYVALTQKQAGQYRTAFRSFNDFLTFAQQHRFKQAERWVNQAEKEIQGILFVYELGAKPQGDFSLTRLPYPINSDYNDYAAQMYRHDTSMVLSSARPTSKGSIYDEKYGEFLGDHFVYEKQQHWEERTSHHQIDNLNTELNEGTGMFNAAGDRFFFTGCYDEEVCRIYVSQRVGQQWSAPQALPPEINAPNFSSKHPALTPDGNTLYFISDRPGGQGMNDIWKSERKQGAWQPAVNMGPVVNTEQNEVSPYYYAPEKQLLFASNGHIGIGGYDLFFTDVSKASPSPVINAGYPFNSHKDDLYFHLGDQRGFLTSNRANRDGNFDVYSFFISTGDISLVALANSRQQTDWYETQFTFSQAFDKKDRAFYEQLPLEEKQQVKQYVDRVAFRQSLSKYEAQSEAQRMEYEKLSPTDQETVQRLVVAKKQFLLENTVSQLSAEDQLYYENLPVREREKIDQMVNTKLFTLLSQENATGSGDETYFYESLSAQEKEIVSGAVKKQQKFYQKSLEEQSTLADIFYYQSLSPKEKRQIEVLARTRSFAFKEKASLPEETQFFYEKLSEENQTSVERMAEARFQFLIKGTQQSLLPEDYQFLATLSPQEKEQLQQLVDYRIERLYFLKSKEDQLLHLTYKYEKLPIQEKAQLERLVQARKLTFKIAQPVNEYSGFDLGKIADALPEKVSIRGRFKSKPSIDLATQLTIYDHRQGTIIYASRDGEKGFVFDNVDYHQNLQVSFNDVTRTFLELPQDEIAELAITVLQDTIIQETFDNIYFDTNRYFIVDSAKHVLDSLAAFHHKYPDVIIQIKAFADSTGTDAYNMKLSGQRAGSITSYLTQRGVNPKSIEPIAMGSERNHDLNYSRRVEFDILGVSASYNPTREVYVIQPEPNLADIARQYQVPLKKLIEWNGGKQIIEPYTPIKIIAKRK